ncbi:calnexin-like [Argiope bruennichi]|uniref:calnexin-like n=1 Tax=Argiope bruennichi TaxID=94029 RepID=UPI002494ED1A|nr:calnexin-like [Argiope bruennichi]
MLFRYIVLLLCVTLALSQEDAQDFPDQDLDIDAEQVNPNEKPDVPEVEIEEIPYSTPQPIGNAYIAEHFDDREAFDKKWISSEAKKEGTEESIAKYDGKWSVEEAERNGLKGDLGLVLKSKAHHHAISARLDKPFLFDNKPFILQYEVRFQNGQECGGAYLKLLSQVPDMDLRTFHDKTPYTLMFGPDKCGNDHKLHFIFRHRNPKNGSFEEKHRKRSSAVPKIDDIFKDKKPHLFTLVINPDNKFEVLLDKQSIHKGSLLEDFNPPVNPEPEIDDPNDMKPADWDEREKIPHPTATKPDDWDEDAPRQIVDPNARKPDGWLDDEPELIPDPNAEKPTDWDDEMDGEWEAPLINNPKCEKIGCGKWKAPMIDNPKYKGKWRAPLIDNPNYKGKWKPRRIPNPHHFEDKYPYKMTPIAAVGFELWSMVDGIMFDNIIITDDLYVAEHWAAETFDLKRELADRETDNMITRLFKYTNKNPWLWAVYLVVIGLPVVLFISFCCTSSRSPAVVAAQRDLENRRKVYAGKTFTGQGDEKSREVPKEATITEVKEEEEEEEEAPVEEVEVLDEEKDKGEEAQKKPAAGEDEEKAPEDDVEEEEMMADQESDAAGDFPRRRRPRKD